MCGTRVRKFSVRGCAISGATAAGFRRDGSRLPARGYATFGARTVAFLQCERWTTPVFTDIMDKVAGSTAQQLWALHREVTLRLGELLKRGPANKAALVDESVV